MEKVFKLFFVPVWRWPKKDSVCLYRECSLLAPGSLGAEPSPSLLPREELWLWELRRPAGQLTTSMLSPILYDMLLSISLLLHYYALAI
ncbi:hypothetical protein PAHAL_3G362200 [Panicum hallii]|uniref:Uncharacterized protein n=1 Tax=Panicum hallii TaxID=206008 RepID=A0A2T8KKJ7_9POAL|nr:uncharacterized protein LOC112884045 isoform X2 [Panicum hallii]PVH62664.1 hypothetical protein PAHAL_3G362200 [Panicum hallii]